MVWDRVHERFDTVFTAILLWFTAGAVFDAWNHNQGAPVTFFTPEHAVAYSAVMAFGVVMAGLVYRAWRRGEPLLTAVPDGYHISLLGVPVMAVGGVGDLLWHRVFGFEVASQEMLSPSHLLLGVGALLLLTGPLRAAWDEHRPGTWQAQFPVVIAASLFFAFTTFMMQFFHPFSVPLAAAWVARTSTAWTLLGIAGIVLHTVAMTAVVLHLVRRFNLPFGAFTVLLGINGIVMTAVQGPAVLIGVCVLTGVLADLHVQVFAPGDRPRQFRLLSFLLPTVLFSLYFATLAAIGGVGWSVHVWSGTIVLAGLTGVITGYLVRPTAAPDV